VFERLAFNSANLDLGKGKRKYYYAIFLALQVAGLDVEWHQTPSTKLYRRLKVGLSGSERKEMFP